MNLSVNAHDRELWLSMLDLLALVGKPRNAKPSHILALLKRAGLSQIAAARELGVDPRTMRRYVLGETPIPPGHLGRLERLTEEGGRP